MIAMKLWKILLVDNDTSLHNTIEAQIKGKNIFARPTKLFHARTTQEAKELLIKHPDIVIAFIDISMKNGDTGFQVVRDVREELQDEETRLILVASEVEAMPEEDIIEHYDINDYVHRDDIQTKKLFTIVRTALKQYSQFREIYDSKKKILYKLTTNEITGVPNRVALSQKLDIPGTKSLVVVDIDDFGVFNENYGFTFGDKLLQVFAKFLIKKYTPRMDVFHLQANTFALLCYEEAERDIEDCVKDIKEEIAQHPFKVKENSLYLTATLGVVLKDTGNIIQKAELALKEARYYGKNRLYQYSEDLHIIKTIQANSMWSKKLRDAFKEKRVHAYFQPIQDIQTKKIQKYEALVRLECEGKIYSPFEFLGAALYSGQIFDIFKFMFETVCQKVQETNAHFSLNLSEYDLKIPALTKFIHATVSKYNISPSHITLEILEDTSISHDKKIQDLINGLHDDGFLIAIDDFGTRCSNFAQLHNLKIDYIKIDGEFIKNIPEDKNAQIITKTILNFAHQANIPVIAEYVCSDKVYAYVEALGVEYAQGYHIAAPAPELFKV
ncbi:EAL domain-containing protein [Sulfurimonas sp.]|uniref:two-component system response regulator n=1 Tax=Sulfurimonas sp. TaxID=2022749 RepID=UPI002612F238|nr:EAL domain-containing protein [Sulfurimonas sp.]